MNAVMLRSFFLPPTRWKQAKNCARSWQFADLVHEQRCTLNKGLKNTYENVWKWIIARCEQSWRIAIDFGREIEQIQQLIWRLRSQNKLKSPNNQKKKITNVENKMKTIWVCGNISPQRRFRLIAAQRGVVDITHIGPYSELTSPNQCLFLFALGRKRLHV